MCETPRQPKGPPPNSKGLFFPNQHALALNPSTGYTRKEASMSYYVGDHSPEAKAVTEHNLRELRDTVLRVLAPLPLGLLVWAITSTTFISWALSAIDQHRGLLTMALGALGGFWGAYRMLRKRGELL